MLRNTRLIVAARLYYDRGMKPNFSRVFHWTSKQFKRLDFPVSADVRTWPAEWLTTYYKSYPALPKIPLEDSPSQKDLFAAIRDRASKKDFADAPLTKRELSLLLKYSCGTTGIFDEGRSRRAQPSGGARFPIEVYPLVIRGNKEVPSGLYHYNVKFHALEVLWKREFSGDAIKKLFVYPWVADASVVFLMTAVFWRSQHKYGDRGYRYILIEAGHIGQNIYLVVEALGLKCCAMGGTSDSACEELLDIDGSTESIIYAVVLGK